MFNHGIRNFIPPPQRRFRYLTTFPNTKSTFVVERDYWREFITFCSVKFQSVSNSLLVILSATFSVGKAREQGVFGQFSTHLFVAHSDLGKADKSFILDFAAQLAEHNGLSPHPYLLGVMSSFYGCNACTQAFRNTLWSNSLLEEPFRNFFWILTEHLPQTRLNDFPLHKRLSSWWLPILGLYYVVTKSEISSYACVQKKNLRCSLQRSAFNSFACGSLTVNSYNRSHDLFIYSLWGTFEITKYSRYEIKNSGETARFAVWTFVGRMYIYRYYIYICM